MSVFYVKILMLFSVLISVAFITLLERKILGLTQNRKGPNKLPLQGLFQPFADALKLFSKPNSLLTFSNTVIYFLSPLMLLLFMMLFWTSFSLKFFKGSSSSFEILMIMIISSFSVYSLIFSGWSSNSKYALLGTYRSIAQLISYEVSFSFIIMCTFIFNLKLTFSSFAEPRLYSNLLMLGLSSIFFSWLIISLAETNRTPFDMAESESELVSGFNIEFSGSKFAFLFMAEYGNIIFMSYLTSIFFLGSCTYLNLKLLIFCSFFLLIRATLIRMRYDNLMNLTWKIILPHSLNFLILLFLFFNFTCTFIWNYLSGSCFN